MTSDAVSLDDNNHNHSSSSFSLNNKNKTNNKNKFSSSSFHSSSSEQPQQKQQNRQQQIEENFNRNEKEKEEEGDKRAMSDGIFAQQQQMPKTTKTQSPSPLPHQQQQQKPTAAATAVCDGEFLCELQHLFPPPFSTDFNKIPSTQQQQQKTKQFLWSPSAASFLPLSVPPHFLKGGGGDNKTSLDAQIFAEDVLCFQRSCLDSTNNNKNNNFLITAYPLILQQRVRIYLRLSVFVVVDALDNNSENHGRQHLLEEFENAFHRWINNNGHGRIAPHLHHLLPFSSSNNNKNNNYNNNNKKQRRVLVLLNPFSGKQRALDLWRRDVEPIWREAGFQLEVLATERTGHATELAGQICLDRVDLLALGSGDGLISEVLHGLCARPDKERALRLPIIHLPMGTGNALAASLAFQANEPFPARGDFCHQIALMAIHPAYRRLRLYRVDIGSKKKQSRVMFLSLSWGLMADIDIGSERFRFLGIARLHIEAFLRVAFLPWVARYRARISYLPLPNGAFRDVLMKKLRLRVAAPSWKKHCFGEEQQNFSEDEEEEEEELISRVDEMPPLDQPVPSNWTSISGEFCFVHVSALSHLGSDLPYIPCARLQEPVLFLTFVQWHRIAHRLHMARILLSIDTSAHLDDPAFEIIPVLACRVEPESGAAGYLALDGEAVNNFDCGTQQCFPFQVGSTNEWRNATVVGRMERRRRDVKFSDEILHGE